MNPSPLQPQGTTAVPRSPEAAGIALPPALMTSLLMHRPRLR